MTVKCVGGFLEAFLKLKFSQFSLVKFVKCKL